MFVVSVLDYEVMDFQVIVVMIEIQIHSHMDLRMANEFGKRTDLQADKCGKEALENTLRVEFKL